MLIHTSNHEDLASMLNLIGLGNPPVHLKMVPSKPMRNSQWWDHYKMPKSVRTMSGLKVIQIEDMLQMKGNFVISHCMSMGRNGIHTSLACPCIIIHWW